MSSNSLEFNVSLQGRPIRKSYRVLRSYPGTCLILASGLPLPCMALVFVPEVGLACHWISIRQSPVQVQDLPQFVQTTHHTVPTTPLGRFKRQVLHGTCVLLVVVLAYKFLPLPLLPPQVPFYNRCHFFFSFSTTQNTSLLFSSDFCLYTRLFSASVVSLYLVARYFIYCRSVGFGFGFTHTHSLSEPLSQSSLFVAQYLHYTFATTNVPQLLLLSVLGNKLLTLYRASYCMS